MARRHFLYVYANGLVAVRDSGQGLEVIAQFAAEFTTDAQEQPIHLGFENWVKDYERDEFTLLIDVVEEDFHTEAIPKLRASDQREMVKRRLLQRYRDARLNQWSVVGGSASGWGFGSATVRGTTRVLLSAITKDQSVLPWLNSIERAKLAVREATSPALLSMRLLKHLLKKRHGFVVSLLPGGLRQTLIMDGEVQLTRLASDLRARDAQAVQIEMLRTVQYLLMSQKLSRDRLRDASMPLYLLDAGVEDAHALPSHLAVDSSVDIPIIALADGRESALLAWCEWTSLQATAGARRGGYLDHRLAHPYRLRAASRWTNRVGASALGLGMVALGGAQLLHWAWPVQTPQHFGTASRTQHQLSQLHTELGRFAVAGPEMRGVVESAAVLEARHVDPLDVLRISADGLADFPQVTLRQLSWKRLVPDSAEQWKTVGMDGKDSAKLGGSTPVPVNGNAFDPSAAMNMAPSGLPAPNTAGALGTGVSSREGPVLVVLDAELPAATPMQQANDMVEALSKALAQRCACLTHLAKMPFDPTATSGYSKSFESSSDDKAKGIPFTVRFLLTPAAPGSVIVQQPPIKGNPSPAG